jgi:crossover junction endodeoxyribonuclease RusA
MSAPKGADGTGMAGNEKKTAGHVGEAPVTPAVPVLQFIAHGTPKPKGSMRHVGHGRMIEQVDGKPWREAVKWAALEAMNSLPPLEGPLRVEATFTFAKPASAPKRRTSWPITRSSGDADKQLRNLFDAMQDAGVMRDDSQIIEATVAKRYPLEGADALTFPGVIVRVHQITAQLPPAHVSES